MYQWVGTIDGAVINSFILMGNASAALSDLVDVDVSGVSNGDVLTRSGNTWIAKSPKISLDDLTDTATAAGKVLYNDGNNWVPVDRFGRLQDLTNVAVSGAPSGHVLYGNGSNWVASKLNADAMVVPSAGELIVDRRFTEFTALRSGSVRLHFSHRGGNNEGHTIRIYRDSSQLVQWYQPSTSTVNRVIDVSFSAGQRIHYSSSGKGSVTARTLRVAQYTIFK